MKYKIGDILIAVKSFQLEDIYQHTYYYGIGDKFIIMEIHHNISTTYRSDPSLRFQLNTNDSVFDWSINVKDLEDDFEEFLVQKDDFIKILRKKKLDEINT
jgi:hypothetical protein